MAKLRINPGPGQRKKIANTIGEIPLDQLACRATAHRWALNDLEFGKRLPRGLSAERVGVEGVFELVDECLRCGKQRRIITGVNGQVGTGTRYYRDPIDWVRLSADLEVVKADLLTVHLANNAAALFGGNP
jgi:hypothetical protein